MVLFKRKPVEFVPPPELPADFDLDQQIWYIPSTGEWFIDYEEYLDRMNYYNIKKFVCETSGNSNFTYFEALKVEKNEMDLMESKFPNPVKEPILRYVSFSTVPRIDVMVDDVYNKFKDDFFPGDQVMVRGPREKFRGVVREKARFNPIIMSNGTVRDGYCSYRVLLETNEEITVNDSSQMSRERNTFTKWFVKSFLKMSLIRANRVGAPWVVKSNVAKNTEFQLNIHQNWKPFKAILEEEIYERHNPLASNGTNQYYSSVIGNNNRSRTRHEKSPDESDNTLSSLSSECTIPESTSSVFEDIKETPPTNSEQEEGRNLQSWKDQWYEILKKCTIYFEPVNSEEVDVELQQKVKDMFEFSGSKFAETFDSETVNFIISLRPYSTRVHYLDDDIFSSVHSHHIKVWHYEKCMRFFKSINITPRKIEQAKIYSKLPGAKTILRLQIQRQLPIEDRKLLAKAAEKTALFTIEEKKPRGGNHSHHASKPNKPLPPVEDFLLPFNKIHPLSKRPAWKKLNSTFGDPSSLLEVWVFINMYSKALIIDNFTFDDYCTALTWTDKDEQCQLLQEIICSLLTAVIDENGEMQITLPEELMEEDDNEEEEEEESKVKEETPIEDGVKKADGTKSNDQSEGEDKPSVSNTDADGKTDGIIKKEIGSEQQDTEVIEIKDEKELEKTEDSDEITHNAYAAIEYRKISWQSRLENRQFKNGGWVIILLGVFSLVDYIPDCSEAINEIYNVLAPGDYKPTPATLERNFYTSLSPRLRLKALQILVDLLLNGTVIRNYIDEIAEKSSEYRRDRFELIRKIKATLEEARETQKQILDILDDINLQKGGRGRGGRPSHNYLPPAPTELEKEVAKTNERFDKLIKDRVSKQNELREHREKKKEIEKHLTELNIKRVRYIGRDAFYNRYWWFERNGLPNLGSSAHGDEEDEDENENNDVQSEDEDSEDKSEEEEEEEDNDKGNNEYISDTYLMGRLWVQGPTDSDRRYHLNISDATLKVFEKEKTKSRDPEEGGELEKKSDKNIENDKESADESEKTTEKDNQKPVATKFANSELDKASNKIFDPSGWLAKSWEVSSNQYSAVQRKALSEAPDMLLGGSDWRYLETAEDFDKFVALLNSGGTRERALKKEATELQDAIRKRLQARMSFLGIGKKSDEQIELEKIIKENAVSEEERQILDSLEEENPQAKDKDGEDESESDESSDKDDNEREDSTSTEENDQTNNRKRKLHGNEINHDSKRAKYTSRPAERIAKRQELRRRIRQIEQKDEKRKEAQEELKLIGKDRERENVLQWVNSSALEKFGHTHYEGPKVEPKKNSKKKKRGRR
ncbi:hypothetical protein HII13_001517 [Brettanomyces bruxellensis]|nr:hypothetical protein HII13_001517 [Brettanomyces bruxellensis]